MTLQGLVLLVVTSFCMATANLLMKNGISQAGGFTLSVDSLLGLLRQPAFVCGILLSGAAAVIWFRVLATQKLSTCYPLFVSITYFLMTLAAFYFLHERITLQKIAGLMAMLLGIAAVARG